MSGGGRALAAVASLAAMAGAVRYMEAQSSRKQDEFFREQRRTPKPGCHQRWKMQEYADKQKAAERAATTAKT